RLASDLIPLVEGTQPVLVFNPHPWPVSADIELQYGVQPTGVHLVPEDDGAQVPSQTTQSVATTSDKGRGAVVFRAEVPALGYRTYRMLSGPGAPPATGPLTVTETLLENEHLRVEIDPTTGDVASLLDKRTGTDVVGRPERAHTQVCEDPTDTWGHRVISYAWEGAPMQLDRIVVRESGPLRARLRIERTWGASRLIEELLLGHDATTLRVDVTLDWREQAHLLKLRFPTALTEPRATYEIPYGELERPVDGAEEPAQTWVDLTGTIGGAPAGLTVIATNKHGWDVSPDASIGITAVRSPVYSWHDPRLLDPEGLYTFQDQGTQRFSYLMAPHAGDHHEVEPTRRGQELGQAPRAMLESSHDGHLPLTHSFVDDRGGPVMVTAVKGAEDPGEAGDDLIVRAVETRGASARASIALPLLDRTLEAEWGPYQLRTFRVRADGEPVEVDLLELPLT
ncbi:glycoside hydrolase family 38 C-terminal domain-containing protein, partial [Pseudactinotalea suaedae]